MKRYEKFYDAYEHGYERGIQTFYQLLKEYGHTPESALELCREVLKKEGPKLRDFEQNLDDPLTPR